MKLALYQPEIPQNTGTLLRMGACLGVPVHIIEPCGFVLSDRRLRRSGMDYMDTVEMVRHPSWAEFREKEGYNRIILLTPHAELPYIDFAFRTDDCLLLGQESIGVPSYVTAQVDDQVSIPMHQQARSLNIALAAAMVLGEALRQTNQLKP